MSGEVLRGRKEAERLLAERAGVIRRTAEWACRRHRLPVSDAEDVAADAMLRLLENEASALRSVPDDARFDAYLRTVVQRLVVDRRRRETGKWFASETAHRLGVLALQLEELIERDRFTRDEAVEIVRSHLADPPSRAALIDLACRLPERTSRSFVGAAPLETLPARELAPDVRRLAGEALEEARAAADRLSARLEELPSEDRLLLKLRFEQGLRVSAIADRLGLKAKPLYKRYDRILGRLRRMLERSGLDRRVLEAFTRGRLLGQAVATERLRESRETTDRDSGWPTPGSANGRRRGSGARPAILEESSLDDVADRGITSRLPSGERPPLERDAAMTACPLSSVATLASGATLPPEERAAVLRHLDACRPCRETFSGVVEQIDAEGVGAHGGVGPEMRGSRAPLRNAPAPRAALALAAALVLTIGWWTLSRTAGDPLAEEVLAAWPAVEGAPVDPWSDPSRRRAFSTTESPDSVRFLLGVLAFDEALARRFGDRVARAEIGNRSDRANDVLRSLGGTPDARAPTYRTGVWVEAARQAGLQGAAPRTLSALREVRPSLEEVPDSWKSALSRLELVLEGDLVDPVALERAAGDVLRVAAP